MENKGHWYSTENQIGLVLKGSKSSNSKGYNAKRTKRESSHRFQQDEKSRKSELSM
jgi:hypothetical protein